MSCIVAVIFFSWYPLFFLDGLVAMWQRRHQRFAPPTILDLHPKRGGPRYQHDTGGDLTAAGDGQPFRPGR